MRTATPCSEKSSCIHYASEYRSDLYQIPASDAENSHVIVPCITQRVSDNQEIKEFASCDEVSAGGSDSICILVNFHGEPFFSWTTFSLLDFSHAPFPKLTVQIILISRRTQS